MAFDTTRYTNQNGTSFGIVIDSAGIATARPVGAIVLNTVDNILYRSTNASVATYTAVSSTSSLGTQISDPGDAAAIPVTSSGQIALTIGAGAETNTLAAPTARGQALSIVAATVGGGTRVITASAAINQTGNTKMTFGAQFDWITLTGIDLTGAGGLAWRISANDGTALS